MGEDMKSTRVIRTQPGRQYHLGVAGGEVAPNILLAGDPERARQCARRFEKIHGEWNHREFTTITGEWSGIPITVIGTGIGADNTEIVIVELSQIVTEPTLIRIGSCGALQPEIGLGDLVVTWGAVRLETTSLHYVPEGYPAVSDPEVALALRAAAQRIGVRYHFGTTATAPGFYAAQGRPAPGFPIRHPNQVEELTELGVLNFEMEASTLLTLASLRGYRAGVVCTTFAQRPKSQFADENQRREFEGRVIDCGLEAFRILEEECRAGEK